MFSAQATADALTLLCCAGNALAVCGGLASLLSPAAFLHGMLRGTLSGAAQLVLIAVLSAGIARAATWSRDATAREEDALLRAARGFLLVPETLARWTLLGRRAVTVWERDGHKLLVGSLPSPALVRGFARVHAKASQVTIINLCRFWPGFADMYEELGLPQVKLPTGASYVVDAVDEVRKRLAAAPKGELPTTLFVHCESGAVAAAVAAAFLAVTGEEADAAAAAERVRAATEGRLVCRADEAARVAELALGLTPGGKGKRAKPGKAPSAKPDAGPAAPFVGSTKAKAAPAAATASATAAAAVGADDDSDDDADDDDDDDDEQAQIRANYARAVAQHGLPGARAAPGSGDCGGWKTVTSAPRPPAAGMSYTAAAKAGQAAAKAAEALSDKQRKNRRKAEKAKEEAANREAQMLERREAARVARQHG